MELKKIMESVDLTELKTLKLHIEKFKADYESAFTKLVSEYETKVKELTDLHKEQLVKSGELYDVKNDLTLEPIYADREVHAMKLWAEKPDLYWKIAHLSPKDICDKLNKSTLEKTIRDNDERRFVENATITVKDAKKELTKREMEDYWLPRKILKYDLDLKIK
jgi:hypothetical protein